MLCTDEQSIFPWIVESKAMLNLFYG